MSRQVPPIVGYTIRCAAPDCGEETARQASPQGWNSPDRAIRAARALGWVLAPGPAGRAAWFCPRHQAWDTRALRWVVRQEVAS